MNLNNLPEIRETATTLAKSTLCPSHFKKPEDALFAILKGAELGLPPVYSLSNISVINGKPSLSTDLMVGLAKKSPEWGGMTVEYSDDNESCTVKIRRTYPNGSEDISTATFSLKQAKDAGLVRSGTPWEKYPSRMLKHRATSWAIRDAFPDLLAGTHDPDEASEITAKPEPAVYEVLDSADPDAPLKANLQNLHQRQINDYKSGKLSSAEIKVFNLEWLFVDETLKCTDAVAAAKASVAYDDFRNGLGHRNVNEMDADEIDTAIAAALPLVYSYEPARIKALNKYDENETLLAHLWEKYLAQQIKSAKKEAQTDEPAKQEAV